MKLVVFACVKIKIRINLLLMLTVIETLGLAVGNRFPGSLSFDRVNYA